MKSLALVTVVATSLTGCQTLTSPTVVNTLREVCTYEPFAYAAFRLFAPTAAPEVVLRVTQAHAIVQSICLTPPTDLATAFATAFNAYLIIQGATP